MHMDAHQESIGVMGDSAFCLCQGFSEMTSEGDNFLSGLKT